MLSVSHSTQSDHTPHVDVFVAVLATIPTEDWRRTLETDRTIMIRRTSKRVKEQVDKILLPAVVHLCTTFLGCKRTIANDLIMNELTVMVSTCLLTTLVIHFTMWDKGRMSDEDTVKLGGIVLLSVLQVKKTNLHTN